MTPLRLVALSQARLGLVLVKHALEEIEEDVTLDAYRVEQFTRIHHAVADWHAFVDAMLAEVAR